MPRNILLIVEGSVDEQSIFEDAFSQYGFHPTTVKEKINVEDIGQLEKLQFELGKNNVVIVQGPRNRIHGFLKMYNEKEMSIERFFSHSYEYFSAIFLIYDVDHNDCDDVREMFRRFPDESTGMLLLSSPCIEVLGDSNHARSETKYHRLKEYKSEINNHHHGRTKEYIKQHLDEIMLFFLKKNYEDFHEPNIMEHPRLLVEKVNSENDRYNCLNREKSYVVYRYFSTVVYVSIAHANGLTREIDNYSKVKDFFDEHRK